MVPDLAPLYSDRVRLLTDTFYSAQLTWIKAEEGAYNQVWAATTERKNLANGAFYMPVGVIPRLAKEGDNEKLAKQLWEWTEEQLKSY